MACPSFQPSVDGLRLSGPREVWRLESSVLWYVDGRQRLAVLILSDLGLR